MLPARSTDLNCTVVVPSSLIVKVPEYGSQAAPLSSEYSVRATPEHASDADKLIVASEIYQPFAPLGADGETTAVVIGATVSGLRSAVVTSPAATFETHEYTAVSY